MSQRELSKKFDVTFYISFGIIAFIAAIAFN